MLSIRKKQDCCGCGACAQKCPKSCISLAPDEEGFSYPQIKEDVCINCGLCEATCPKLQRSVTIAEADAYAMINKEESVRMRSSSGGIFRLLAEKAIRENGVVFGAKFDKDWNVVLSFSETIEDLDSFYGSKYVQADTNNSYKEVKDFLKEGRLVLFSGTPCQIAALKSFLGKKYANLFTVDVSCHGVPSPILWQKYLLEECNNDITEIKFRDKHSGWRNFHLTIRTNEKNCSKNVFGSSYLHAFVKNMSLRPSCYDCQFKNGGSGSDITLADFWGIEKITSKVDDNKGTSLVLFRSQKMKDWFPFEKCVVIDVPYEKSIALNEGLKKRNIKHPNRNKFYRDVFAGKTVSSAVSSNIRTTLVFKIYKKLVNILV